MQENKQAEEARKSRMGKLKKVKKENAKEVEIKKCHEFEVPQQTEKFTKCSMRGSPRSTLKTVTSYGRAACMAHTHRSRRIPCQQKNTPNQAIHYRQKPLRTFQGPQRRINLPIASTHPGICRYLPVAPLTCGGLLFPIRTDRECSQKRYH